MVLDGGSFILPGDVTITVNSGVSAGLNNLTLQRGQGAINNAGNLVVTNSMLYQNYSSTVVNSGVLTISNSTVTGSSANAATIVNSGGTITISSSTIAGNFSYPDETISGRLPKHPARKSRFPQPATRACL